MVVKRIQATSVTDAIASAMEKAEDMESVIILYQNKPHCEVSFGFITDPDTSVATTNWLVDTFKAWLLGCYITKEED